tara:strand:- start:854 stop:1144 length:291 start_codon:yes stop_codon:yes gene_type:complete
MNREIYNIILVHTARTWERMRLTQPHQEMPYDNIASTDEIQEVASTIYHNDIIQGFLNAPDDLSKDRWWIDNVDEGMSDEYIEVEAENIINREYLN